MLDGSSCRKSMLRCSTWVGSASCMAVCYCARHACCVMARGATVDIRGKRPPSTCYAAHVLQRCGRKHVAASRLLNAQNWTKRIDFLFPVQVPGPTSQITSQIDTCYEFNWHRIRMVRALVRHSRAGPVGGWGRAREMPTRGRAPNSMCT